MVARVQQPGSGLIVTFWRRNEPPESIHCSDGYTAWDHAILMVSKREFLRPGDVLLVRRDADVATWPADDDRFSDWPPGGGRP